MMIVTTNSKLLHVVAIAAICLLRIAETSVQIQANPPDINVVEVKPLTIKCTYIDDTKATTKRSLQSLTLSKRDQVLGTFDVLSEITHSNPSSPSLQNTNIFAMTSASGHIMKNNGTSFLSVAWSAPSTKEAGSFRCSAHLSDSSGLITTEIRDAQVRDDSVPVLVQKIKSLENQILQQESCCQQAAARIAEFDIWRKIISTSMKYLANNLIFSRSSEYNNRTYIASNFTVTGITNAEAICQTMGGYLAEVDDAQEWAFIITFLKMIHFSFVYIGGQDDITEGSWYWMHSRKPLTFAPWGKTEPNNLLGEDCLEVYFHNAMSDFALNDISCTARDRGSFLCEIPNSGNP